jgi:hypothetical protein
MNKCPVCGSMKVYPSRHRNTWERVRQLFTEKRPYRCHACNRRQWASIEIRLLDQPDFLAQAAGPHLGDRPMTPEQMDRLDLPGADRIDASKTAAKRPLPPESFDRLDPDAAE